jgi:hypothetical protein
MTRHFHGEYLHPDGHPSALSVLVDLLLGRPEGPPTGRVDFDGIDGMGAWVDWDALERCPDLALIERAAVYVAHGIAIAEGNGGWPDQLRNSLVKAIEEPPSPGGEW